MFTHSHTFEWQLKAICQNEIFSANKVVQMGPNRCLTYIWSFLHNWPLNLHTGKYRTVWECLPPYAGVVGGEWRSLAPCSLETIQGYWVIKSFLLHLSYTNLCYTTLSNSTASLVGRIIMKLGKTQWQQSSVVLTYNNKWSSLTFGVWNIMTNSDKYN